MIKDIFNDNCKYFRWRYDEHAFAAPGAYKEGIWSTVVAFSDFPKKALMHKELTGFIKSSLPLKKRKLRTVDQGIRLQIKLTCALGLILVIPESKEFNTYGEFALTRLGFDILRLKQSKANLLVHRQFLLLCKPYQRLINSLWPTEEILFHSEEHKERLVDIIRADMPKDTVWNKVRIQAFLSDVVTNTESEPDLGVVREQGRLFLSNDILPRILNIWIELVQYEIARYVVLNKSCNVSYPELINHILMTLLIPRFEIDNIIFKLEKRGFLKIAKRADEIRAITSREDTSKVIYSNLAQSFSRLIQGGGHGKD